MNLASVFEGDATAVGLKPLQRSIAHILKANPWRDADGKYTTKEKAVYQQQVFSDQGNELQGLIDQHGSLDAALNSKAGKQLVKDMSTSFHKLNKHTLDSSGYTANLQGAMNDAYKLEPQHHQALMKKIKLGAQAKKAWDTMNMKKAEAHIGDDLPGMLQKMAELEAATPATAGLKAANTKAKAKLQAQMDQKLSFWKTQYESTGGDPANFDAMVAAKKAAAKAGIGATGATGVPTYVTPATPKQTAPAAPTAPTAPTVMNWLPAKDKADAVFQNNILGVNYYKMRHLKGQDHADTKAAYAEWQKSKDWLKADNPSLDIGQLSVNQKTQAAKEIQAAKDAADAPKKALEKLHATIKDGLTESLYKIKMAEDQGLTEAKDKATAIYDKLVQNAKDSGMDTATIQAALVAGVNKANTSINAAKNMKALLADHKSSIDYYDNNNFIDLHNSGSASDPFLKHQHQQVNALTDAERKALTDYTNSGYKTTNKAAVGVSTMGAKNEKLAQEAMSKMTLGADVKLRRNAPHRWFWESFGFKDFNNLTEEQAQSIVGKTYTEKAYSSTSKNPDFTSYYSQEAGKTGAMIYRIRAHKDIRGLDVHTTSVSSHGSESEVVLDKNVTYVVRSVKKMSSSTGFKYEVEVDALGHV